MSAKYDEANRTLNDFDAAKKKLAVENAELLRHMEEADTQLGQLTTLKLSLSNQLDDMKKMADEESRVSHHLRIVPSPLVKYSPSQKKKKISILLSLKLQDITYHLHKVCCIKVQIQNTTCHVQTPYL